MNQIKILHCADLHLGAELSSLGVRAKQRREELLIGFYRIVAICKEENVELLLIAGDFFEGSDIDKNIVQSVKEALAGIPDVIVGISPGNHDYFSIDSPYSDLDWPTNVHIFRSGLEQVAFPEKNLRLWGAGFTRTYVTDALLYQQEIPQDEFVNICVMHGDLVAENQPSHYNPLPPLRISQSGMDYLALGHIHKRTAILQSGTVNYAYPGCPEGKGFDELGEKGVYIGNIAKGKADLSFRAVCGRMNLEIPVDISGCATNSETAGKIIDAIHQRYGESFHNHLYKIILEGEVSGFTPDCVAVSLLLENEVYFVKMTDRTHAAVNLQELAKETSLKGIFVRKMLEKINECARKNREMEAQQYKRALYIGIKAFDSEVTLNEH